ncbi:MAG TPA: aminoglycoside 3'-phosphotransferase [Chloroflexota bacterium]|nr:aminoglycoside 3'-phosphotransferase [Chloroflexota bacterium]
MQTDSPDGAQRIPAAALGGMAGWRRTVVWQFLPQVTTWRLVAPDGEVRYLKVSQLGQRAGLADERERMIWAAAWLPVPRVIEHGSDGYDEWLLTAGLPGVNAVDDALRVDPARLVPLLAEGLRWFHTLPVAECPFDGRFGLDHRPPGDEDSVVCHGDYCLPNVLIDDWRVSGFVDLGELGVADRWADLTMATWSVTRNLGPGWEQLFMASYGVAPDPAKRAFYRRLHRMDD